ncbi:MAG TPA: hypothetical protein VGJ26_04740 [Pirellulales bacterium]|jgi:hypothetical protein
MILRSVALRASLSIPILLLACGLFLSPAVGAVIVGPASVSAPFGDDVHTSTLNPYPLINISTITYPGNPALNGQCVWINAGLDAFIKANPVNGSGPSGAGWSYTWAGVAQEAAVEKGLSLVSYNANGNTYDGYNPYVVSQPDVVAGNGTNYPSDITNAEAGGAVLNLKYTPGNGAPVLNGLHWIQGYTGSLRGNAFGPILDNVGGGAYSTQGTKSPYYDAPPGGGGGTAGTLPGGGGWFLDTPFATEGEYELNPVVTSQFQVALVTDTVTNQPLGPGGALVPQHALTIYGGDWWGYTYTTVETPEPATWVLAMCGVVGVSVTTLRARRRQR